MAPNIATPRIDLGDRRLVVCSNREPYKVTLDDGRFAFEATKGGLASALTPVMRSSGGLWISWGGREHQTLRLSHTHVRVCREPYIFPDMNRHPPTHNMCRVRSWQPSIPMIRPCLTPPSPMSSSSHSLGLGSMPKRCVVSCRAPEEAAIDRACLRDVGTLACRAHQRCQLT